MDHLQNGRVPRQRQFDESWSGTTFWKRTPHLGSSFLAADFNSKGGGEGGEGGVQDQQGVGGERHGRHAQEH